MTASTRNIQELQQQSRLVSMGDADLPGRVPTEDSTEIAPADAEEPENLFEELASYRAKFIHALKEPLVRVWNNRWLQTPWIREIGMLLSVVWFFCTLLAFLLFANVFLLLRCLRFIATEIFEIPEDRAFEDHMVYVAVILVRLTVLGLAISFLPKECVAATACAILMCYEYVLNEIVRLSQSQNQVSS